MAHGGAFVTGETDMCMWGIKGAQGADMITYTSFLANDFNWYR